MKKKKKIVDPLILILYGISLFLLIGIMIFFIRRSVIYLSHPEIFDKNEILLTTILTPCFILLLLICLFCAFLVQRKRALYLTQFNQELGVITEEEFKNRVQRQLKKKKEGTRILVSFEIQNFQDGIVVGLGYNVGLQVLQKVVGVTKKYYLNQNDLEFGYNSTYFLLYRFYEEGSSYLDEFKALEEEIDSEVEKLHLNIPILLTFGIYFIENTKEELSEMVRKANIARHIKVGIGKQNMIIFKNTMVEDSRQDLILMNEMEKGLENGEFEVYYQPKFDIKINRFVGSEALVRWNHPVKGFIGPEVFLPLAERSGFIFQLNKFIIEQICKDLQSLRERKKRLLTVSFNLSNHDLQRKNLIPFLKHITEKYEINTKYLEVELTESIVAKDILFSAAIIKKIREMGIRVAMDDFGTGYSSLSVLKKFSFDTIKIDKSFFSDMERDKQSRNLVSAIVDIAKILNCYVVAEGIEEQGQVNIMKRTDCDAIQGYYYSRPLSFVDYEHLLEQNRFETKNKKNTEESV